MSAEPGRWRIGLPRTLAGRLLLTLTLALLGSYVLLFLLWRVQVDSTVAPIAQGLQLVVESLREDLRRLPPDQRAAWIAQRNARGDLQLEVDAGPVAIRPRSLLTRALEQRVQDKLGADVALSVQRLPVQALRLSFGAAGTRYAVTLPVSRAMRGWPLLGLLISLGGLLWAALAFVIWQVHRPLRQVTAALTLSRERVEPLTMPASTPTEFRVFADQYNAMAGRLAAQEQERRLLLAGVSHDLRAPLTRLRMRAELLDDTVAAAALARDAESMRRIIDQFLDYHRDPRIAPRVDVAALLARVVQSFAGLGHALVATGIEAPLYAATDALALERVLGNLIDNALAHGAPPVEVELQREASTLRLSVRDRGPGIAGQEIARLLRPFERLDSARSAQGHCGLGLAIVARLVEQLGGHLAICNASGGGLSATVELPLVD
ncbi:MAG: two-component sensor histidine kinase [Hydrocarboniphaga sp.]|uniref:ATP-binding protein n=1 Tax=Hydrocarboniphaga sp. TaxID=2033016 RepID=UPI002607340D|nr:ATP-binding protein [Hydrocarboniphaga sp.]MDB5972272.1 two-component sensor histidine kinase [Hydrocarboniphaga sp.]